MENTRKIILKMIAVYFVLNFLFVISVLCQRLNYEASYLRSCINYPFHADLGDREIQGVAHDNDNWYFTWTNSDPNIGFLSKIPLGVPLDQGVLGALTPQNPNQAIVDMRQFPALNDGLTGPPSTNGYWHWGDPDHYKDKLTGIDYIVVPMTGTYTPVVAFFRAIDLSLAAYGKLNGQQSTGWCAIHPLTGDLYTSEDFDYARGANPCNPNRNCDDQSYHCLYPRMLLHYFIPWDTIPLAGSPIEIALSSRDSKEMLSPEGNSLELYNMQGGEFTPSGELLYITAGSGCCAGTGSGQEYAFDGLYVFDTQTWKEIKRAKNHYCTNPICPSGPDKYFDYYYLMDCDDCFTCTGGSWSPEGLTFWDLDNSGKDQQVSGQLHVLLYHCQVAGGTASCSDNEVAFEHFGGRLYVDATKGVDQAVPTNLGNDPLPGTIGIPFKTLIHTYNSYPAWDGSEIVIKAGSYSAVGTYSTRVRLVSQGGSAILGR